jgi:hypothetical protein
MYINEIEKQLTGGHPNSLGNTKSVVDEVLKDKKKLDDLFACYNSHDEVVRLRVSNAIKRICKEKPTWIANYLDLLLTKISTIDQASTKWTLSTLFMLLDDYMSDEQRNLAIQIMKKNLLYDDWIVQNTTAEALAHFAQQSEALKQWLLPELTKLTTSEHKSVARRAAKLKTSLS